MTKTEYQPVGDDEPYEHDNAILIHTERSARASLKRSHMLNVALLTILTILSVLYLLEYFQLRSMQHAQLSLLSLNGNLIVSGFRRGLLS